MSLLTQAYLLDKYGPRLSMEQLAEVLNITRQSLYNHVTKGTLGVKTYKEGTPRYADYRDVAEYLDEARKQAA